MNIEIANSLSRYISVLYEDNINLIYLCEIQNIENDNFFNVIKKLLDIIQDIPRLIPYKYDNKERKLYLNHEYGFFEYKNEISFIVQSYNPILNENMETLDNIRKIRNKYEHKLHDIKVKTIIYGNTSLCKFTFNIIEKNKKVNINIELQELIKIFKQLNNLFSKLIDEIINFIDKTYPEKKEYPYYNMLKNISFENFNQKYNTLI